MSIILSSTILLGTLGLVSAVVLYVIARRFSVQEDPRIDQIVSLLPGANCGGCGYNGCRDFAVACCNSTSLDSMVCPGAGDIAMCKISSIVGLASSTISKRVATLRCNGSIDRRKPVANFDGIVSCRFQNTISGGTLSCVYGCLGCGDCVSVCRWNAISINNLTRLPEINNAACTGCGACSDICPRNLIEITPLKRQSIYVACSNCDKAKEAMSACQSACIGCGKCKRTCTFDAIVIRDNHAWIDQSKCRSCGKCIDVCPTGAIHVSELYSDNQTVTTQR